MYCNRYDKIAVVVEPIMGGSFLTFNSNTACDTCGTGTVNPSGAFEFTPGLSGVRVQFSV